MANCFSLPKAKKINNVIGFNFDIAKFLAFFYLNYFLKLGEDHNNF